MMNFKSSMKLLLQKPQRGMARAAALHVEVIKALGGQAGPRTVVALNELFDRLITYRNRKIGHANEIRSSEEFAQMAPFLLGGAIDFFERIDVLAGRKLVFIADVRQDMGRRRIVRCRSWASRPARPRRNSARSSRWTGCRPGETYLESPSGDLRPLGSLGSYDPIEQTFSFKPAAPPTPSECVLPTRLDPHAIDGPQQCSFDDFQLMTRLGAGGAGAVFRARQQSVDRDVALKRGLRRMPRPSSVFLREVAALGRDRHLILGGFMPTVRRAFSAITRWSWSRGGPLGVMQHLIRGADGEVGVHRVDACRDDRVRACPRRRDETRQHRRCRCAAAPEPPPTPPPDLRAGPDYIRRVVELIAQVADAAHALHEAQPQGIIHRDIKPSNIIVTPDNERAVLVDLGLGSLPDDATDRAKLTRTRQFVGTARYCAARNRFSTPIASIAGPMCTDSARRSGKCSRCGRSSAALATTPPSIAPGGSRVDPLAQSDGAYRFGCGRAQSRRFRSHPPI